jgi:hypothetical protein
MTSRAGLKAVSLALVAVAVCVASCDLGAPDVRAPADSVTTARAEALLLDLYEQVTGSTDDRRAQEFLLYAATQAPVASCMSAAGLTYTVPPFHDAYAGWDRLPLPDTFPELPKASVSDARAHGFEVGEHVLAARRAAAESPDVARFRQRVEAYEALPQAEKDAYDARLTVCNTSIPANAETAGTPSGQQSLSEALEAVEKEAVHEVDVPGGGEEYADCMAAQDIHVGSVEGWESLYGSVLKAYTPFTPDEMGTASLDPSHPDFARAQRFERRAAVADARCRGAAHALTMQVLLPMLQRFSSDHASQLSALRDEWRRIRAEAARARAEWPW